MTRKIVPIIILILLVATGWWGYPLMRQVDGRTVGEWLALAEHAARTVTYHAEGHTLTGKTRATFVQEQGEAGRYSMRVTDARGGSCSLGFDGDQAWFAAGTQPAHTIATEQSALSIQGKGAILGTGKSAGCATVRMRVQSGSVRKILAIDRKTGVILAMDTTIHGKLVSSMRIDKIDYRPVTVTGCHTGTTIATGKATPAEIRRVLGREALSPKWLPKGFSAQGSVISSCDCCQGEMVTQRYTDGMRALTLFQMPGGHSCTMESGCLMAPTGDALMETRHIGKTTVVAVGEVEQGTMARILDSLR